MIHGGMKAAMVAVGAATVLALVSGCTLLNTPAHPTTTSTASPDPDPVPIAQQLPNLLVAGQTIGTGQLRVIEHEPIPGTVTDHPLTGAVRIVVGQDRGLEVHITPDDPSAVNLGDIMLTMTGKRHDGKPENIQDENYYGLVAGPSSTAGDLVMRLPLDSPAAGDPTFLHSLEESPPGDARVFAVATIDWTLPPAYPGLAAADHGSVANARGRTVLDGGTLAYYVPGQGDTIYQVSRRFGLTEAQLVWLNPELLIGSPQPYLKYGIGVNLDPGRR
ncbi:LysM peptidoglycan-binding domain-containing protein [Leifsonia sp. 22587]|uniref:LysM peptidoglycan-binding domain-containing protein n=1 Tax=Leifsonia sp. 22587 TaxID=3453946 RepID=UPI003F82A6C0